MSASDVVYGKLYCENGIGQGSSGLMNNTRTLIVIADIGTDTQLHRLYCERRHFISRIVRFISLT